MAVILQLRGNGQSLEMPCIKPLLKAQSQRDRGVVDPVVPASQWSPGRTAISFIHLIPVPFEHFPLGLIQKQFETKVKQVKRNRHRMA